MSIIRSGSFTLRGYQFISASGDWVGTHWQWSSGGPLSTLVYSGPTILDTTTEGNGHAPGAPPPGFTLTDTGSVSAIASVPNAPGPGTPFRTRIAGHTLQWGAASGSPGNPTLDPVPPATYLQLLSAITDFEINSAGIAWGEVNVFAAADVEVTGDYDIVMYWWTIPALSECGDEQESHLQLVEAETDPGDPWERLDPLDPDAAPVPTVDTVTPNHGPLAGGTPLVIDGSGFGDACTVTIGGVAATSVVTVSQHRITCLSPAHAAGSVTVVVTNEDGVTS